ncbi:hypothetical protein BP5796_06261 [Coleophoma crateriformis]|uniref:Uncharacterized protein n=1 Tax=Coleophoma crateriformis TaxID=565419 RepID=A0A3D8RWF4_9HELO|nr:hypothetical protein BP5796_06261 [Coleophoma crateriformis]
MLSINIAFAVTFSRSNTPLGARAPPIIASVFVLIALLLLTLLLGRHIRYRNGGHVQDIGRGPQYTQLLNGLCALFSALSAITTAVSLAMLAARTAHLPTITVHSTTRSLISGGFVIWAISLVSEGTFIISMVVALKRSLQVGLEAPPVFSTDVSEMKESERRRSGSANAEDRGPSSIESSRPSRSRSDTLTSIRSSLSIVVRPITSKTRLMSASQKPAQRPASDDSGYRDTVVSVEDGFDSWDTSAVDPQSRQAVMESASPTPPRCPLETIPASPSTSRSPSPGFPLDLEPPRKTRPRSRSYSPARNYAERETRTISPTPSLREAHIHPLFRTDSPEPPPAVTPGTIITAAPAAGQVLATRPSIKSLRLRSGSIPVNPLLHSESLDSIRREMEQEDRVLEEQGAERTLTPPIPDWVMGAGSRSSMALYKSRRKPQSGNDKDDEAES